MPHRSARQTRLIAIAALTLALFTAPTLQAQSASQAAGTQPPTLRGPMAQIAWLAGRWVGSGGSYSAFYEEYRVLNDTTLEQREVDDAAFTQQRSNGVFTVRDGQIVKLNARGEVTTRITVVADTVSFASTTPGRGSYRWIRTGPTTWRAELARVTYELRRP
ncbi:MAG: hypothetical protein KF709_12575 [Gemmatimonadaceae bacterium]|nr:hypothetical protein [Gemmatimonadaceae bacterium]